MKKFCTASVLILAVSACGCFTACNNKGNAHVSNKEEFASAIIATLGSTNLTFDATIEQSSLHGTISFGMKLDFDNNRFCIYGGDDTQKSETYYYVEDGAYKILSLANGELSSQKEYEEADWRAYFEAEFYGTDIAPFNVINSVRDYNKFVYDSQKKTYTYSVESASLVLTFKNGVMISSRLTQEDYKSYYEYRDIGTTSITIPTVNSEE